MTVYTKTIVHCDGCGFEVDGKSNLIKEWSLSIDHSVDFCRKCRKAEYAIRKATGHLTSVDVSGIINELWSRGLLNLEDKDEQ